MKNKKQIKKEEKEYYKKLKEWIKKHEKEIYLIRIIKNRKKIKITDFIRDFEFKNSEEIKGDFVNWVYLAQSKTIYTLDEMLKQEIKC